MTYTATPPGAPPAGPRGARTRSCAVNKYRRRVIILVVSRGGSVPSAAPPPASVAKLYAHAHTAESRHPRHSTALTTHVPLGL